MLETITENNEMISADCAILDADNELLAVVEQTNELEKISNRIDITNSESVLTYGQDAATEISKFADEILSQMQLTKIEESSVLMKRLNEIMKEFDAKDFQEEKKGFLSKIFGSAKDSIDKVFGKYQTMGSKVDEVYQELKVYENQIKTSNVTLDEMFSNNMEYYKKLELYIRAGHFYVDKLKNNEIKELENKANETGEQIDLINLNDMNQAVEMFEQRIFDLELAKNVSLQALPQIKLIQKGNFDLVRKINSAFIVTLPIFKQGLTQAIALKRQKIQAEAMAELDKTTNELILKNAENTAAQSKLTAKLASGSSIKVETLQQSWQTIMNGIEETRRIQDEAIMKREEGAKLLSNLQDEYKKKLTEI